MGNKGAFIILKGGDLKPKFTSYEHVVSCLLQFAFPEAWSPVNIFWVMEALPGADGVYHTVWLNVVALNSL